MIKCMVLDGDCIDERHLMLVVFWAPNVHSMYNLRHVGHEHDVVVEAHWSSQRGTIMS